MSSDKIKELAVQAMDKHFPSFDNITARGQYSSSTYNRAIEEMMLMFAELIVKECLDACNENNKSYYAHVGIAACVKSIRQRFGIEE